MTSEGIKPGSRVAGHPAGFTLIELLLAIFIFSVVVSVVYGSYRATFHVIGGAEHQINAAHQATVTLERFRDDLESAVIGYYGSLKGEKREESDLPGISLTFLASQHLRLQQDDQRRGWAEVRYYTKVNDSSGLLDLYRDDTLFVPKKVTEETTENNDSGHLLCSGLRAITIGYTGVEDVSSEEWDSEKMASEDEQMPRLITLDLELASPNAAEQSWNFRTAVALRVELKE